MGDNKVNVFKCKLIFKEPSKKMLEVLHYNEFCCENWKVFLQLIGYAREIDKEKLIDKSMKQ